MQSFKNGTTHERVLTTFHTLADVFAVLAIHGREIFDIIQHIDGFLIISL